LTASEAEELGTRQRQSLQVQCLLRYSQDW
jgi:hypothetical protein